MGIRSTIRGVVAGPLKSLAKLVAERISARMRDGVDLSSEVEMPAVSREGTVEGLASNRVNSPPPPAGQRRPTATSSAVSPMTSSLSPQGPALQIASDPAPAAASVPSRAPAAASVASRAPAAASVPSSAPAAASVPSSAPAAASVPSSAPVSTGAPARGVLDELRPFERVRLLTMPEGPIPGEVYEVHAARDASLVRYDILIYDSEGKPNLLRGISPSGLARAV